jgi:hypothetical protein
MADVLPWCCPATRIRLLKIPDSLAPGSALDHFLPYVPSTRTPVKPSAFARFVRKMKGDAADVREAPLEHQLKQPHLLASGSCGKVRHPCIATAVSKRAMDAI